MYVRSARTWPAARLAPRGFRRHNPEPRGGEAGSEEAVARAERHLLDPERQRELAELEEAIVRTRRRLDELHRRYLEIVRGVLAEHAETRAG